MNFAILRQLKRDKKNMMIHPKITESILKALSRIMKTLLWSIADFSIQSDVGWNLPDSPKNHGGSPRSHAKFIPG